MPDFFILGAQKCGSTWLIQCLDRHPDVVMLPPRRVLELDTFDQSHVEQFLEPARSAPPGKVIGYRRICFGHPRIAERLHRAAPDIRIVVSLRDPVSRAVSSWYQDMETALVPVMPVEQGLADLLDGKLAHRWPDAAQVIEIGFYYKHLCEFLNYFSRDRIHVVLADELRARPDESIADLCRFAGVDPAKLPEGRPESSNPGHYSMTHQRIARAMLPMYYKRRDEGPNLTRPFGKLRWKFFKHLIDERMLQPMFRAPAPKLSPIMQRRLAEVYRDDLMALQDLLERDLSHWPTVALLKSQTPS